MLPATDDGTSFPRDSDIVNLANVEMVTKLVPWLLKAREGWLLQYTSIPLVANQAEYTLPSRAVGAEFANIILVDANGSPVFPASSRRTWRWRLSTPTT